MDILSNRFLNKGSGFTQDERRRLRITGLLPPRVFTLEEQKEKALINLRHRSSDLGKYVFLANLQDQNETLFYRLVMDHMDEIMPIIYTPTVGKACQTFSYIHQGPRGLFISLAEKGRIAEVLSNWPEQDVRVIVVTDGERILGLGDLGANGMGIPIGKLSLYTACAGIPPRMCLPITIDVGTNNERNLKDPHYIGLKQRRVTGKDYDELLEEFVTETVKRFPKVLIQFEDFGNANAFKLLEKYQHKVCCFNDDIQGTASVAFSGVLSALRIVKKDISKQRILFHGAGEAALGIAELVVFALQKENISEEEARKICWFVDSGGLVESQRKNLNHHKQLYAHKFKPVKDLLAAVKELKPTILIGASGQGKQFTKEVIEEMSFHNNRPIIFALSNPTSKAECTAEEAYRWSQGKAIYSSGSPFQPVQLPSGQTFVPGQGNNSYIFPGVGLGVVASGSKLVNTEMFYIAGKVLSEKVSAQTLETGCIYPPLKQIREVSHQIALAVADYAFKVGFATVPRPENLSQHVFRFMYSPNYSEEVQSSRL